MCLFAATALAATTTKNVTTFDELKAALSNSTITDVVIRNDITTTETLVVNGTKTLRAETGVNVTLTRGFTRGTTTAMIAVNKGALLTLNEGVTIDGDSYEQMVSVPKVTDLDKADTKQATAIDVYGRLILNGAKIVNHLTDFNSWSSPIIVHDGADMTMEKGEIAKNKTYGQYKKDGGGAILVVGGGSLTINGGSIHDNISNGFGGGICVLAYKVNGTYKYGTFVLNGGDFYKNRAVGNGGAIYVDTHAHFTMNYAKIHENKAPFGGGIQLGDVDEDKDGESGQFRIFAGEIYENEATNGHGGGIFIAPRCICLKLNDVYVGGNYATGKGGGLYNCPTGRSHLYLTHGSAFVGNKADEAGDFIFSENKAEETTFLSKVHISDTILGGGSQKIYLDSDSHRYKKKDAPLDESQYKDVTTELLLHNEIDSADKVLAKNAAKLLIYNNSAFRNGGGIANNGELTFGEGMEKQVTVSKFWEIGTIPVSAVQISLIRIDENNQRVTLKTVELNEDNGMTYCFTELPSEYDYEVTEEEMEGYVATVEKVADYGVSKIYYITNRAVTAAPTATPTTAPTATPTAAPTATPTTAPTATPTTAPTATPTTAPTATPTVMPTTVPTITPTATQTPAQDEVDEDILNSMPKTGDDSKPGWWLGLMLVSVILLGSGEMHRRIKNKK